MPSTITPTFKRVPGDTNVDGWQVTWAGLANGDSGAVVGSPIGDIGVSGAHLAGYSDRTIQVSGTFGSGGSVACEGSNDGSNYVALSDPQGTAIAITSAGIKQVTEATIQVRPHVTAGDGTTALTITMFFRKTHTP